MAKPPSTPGLGLAACHKGMSVGFNATAARDREVMEAGDDRRPLNLYRRLVRLKLPIIDELCFAPLSPTGAELFL